MMSFHRGRNWGPPMITSANISKSKENLSFMPDTAKSSKGTDEQKPWFLLSRKYWNRGRKHEKSTGI